MPVPPLPELMKTYRERFVKMNIRPERLKSVKFITDKVIANKSRYEVVSKATKVPWYVIGIIHMMECGGSFDKHMHNGDSLAGRTERYPPGRPVADPVAGPGKPYTWEESAIDSLLHEKLDQVSSWHIESILYHLEKYNGMGYYSSKANIPSPYLWSFTDIYTKGKYKEIKQNGKWISVFDPELVSQQVGAAAMLKYINDNALGKTEKLQYAQ